MPRRPRRDAEVADPDLAAGGREQVAWAESRMPMLRALSERFSATRPLSGVTIGACLHVTPETAVLVRVLAAGGADVALCASNPLSTRDDVVATLALDEGVAVFASRREDEATSRARLDAVIARRPQLTVDDGCDLLQRLHLAHGDQLGEILAGTEDTTSGAIRLRRLAAAGELAYPVLDVSGATTRELADNRHGTAQSVLVAIAHATNVVYAGATVVVAGYGNCGRGIAAQARGLGANVVVTEVDPVRAMAASLDGFVVAEMSKAAPDADIVVTATGNREVVTAGHLMTLRDGAVLANAGQFDAEIDRRALEDLSSGRRRVRPMVDEYEISGPRGLKRLLLLAEGRIVNLAAGEGSSPEVMDVSFAVQALSCEWLALSGARLGAGVHEVPPAIDEAVARVWLGTRQVSIDELTEAQKAYLASWGHA